MKPPSPDAFGASGALGLSELNQPILTAYWYANILKGLFKAQSGDSQLSKRRRVGVDVSEGEALVFVDCHKLIAFCYPKQSTITFLQKTQKCLVGGVLLVQVLSQI